MGKLFGVLSKLAGYLIIVLYSFNIYVYCGVNPTTQKKFQSGIKTLTNNLAMYLLYMPDWEYSIVMGPARPMLCSSQASILHFEWVNVPGHVVTNDETSSPPLCWSYDLIPNMHLPNYYKTGWINLLDVEPSPSKYWPVSIYQVGITSVCYLYQKIVILIIQNTNFWWFRTRILKCLMIPHMNIAYTHDDFQF